MMRGRPAVRSAGTGVPGGGRPVGDTVGAGPEPPVRGLPAGYSERRLPGPAPRNTPGGTADDASLTIRVEFVVVDGPAAQAWRSRQSAAVRALLGWTADQTGGTPSRPARQIRGGREV